MPVQIRFPVLTICVAFLLQILDAFLVYAALTAAVQVPTVVLCHPHLQLAKAKSWWSLLCIVDRAVHLHAAGGIVPIQLLFGRLHWQPFLFRVDRCPASPDHLGY